MKPHATIAPGTVRADLGLDFALSSDRVLAFIRGYSYKFAAQISETAVEGVRALVAQSVEDGWSIKKLRKELQGKFEGWSTPWAQMVAQTESFRAANAGSFANYQEAGVTAKVWIADAEACPYCAPLDGQVIAIDQNFFDLGDEYHPPGVERVMLLDYEAVPYPPLHPNCGCGIGAAWPGEAVDRTVAAHVSKGATAKFFEGASAEFEAFAAERAPDRMVAAQLLFPAQSKLHARKDVPPASTADWRAWVVD
jgi:SPP1 gp7 family putative phage head morphogenesis protein